MRLIFIILFVAAFFNLKAQKIDVYLGTQVPLQYHFGVDYHLKNEKLMFHTGAGILTKPYDRAIINIMLKLGANDKYVQLVSNSFQQGLFLEGGAKYFMNEKNYIGVHSQYIVLKAADTPIDIVTTLLGVNLISSPTTEVEPDVKIKSNLLQLGINYGKVIPFSNDKFKLRLELGVGKNITSKTYMFINNDQSDELSQEMDKELKPIYRKYAYTPSINFYVTYNLFSK